MTGGSITDLERSKLWTWIIGFTLAGLALLWWSAEQLQSAGLVMGSTFEFATWRFVGWLVTLISAGIMFGLAVRAGRGGVSSNEMRGALVAGIVPLAVIVGFLTEWLFDWTEMGTPLKILLRSQTTAAASSIIVGVSAASVVAHLASRSGAVDSEPPTLTR